VDVKKKKRKEKKEKIIIEKEMCVFVYFFLCMLLNQKKKKEFNILIYMHKYLKDKYKSCCIFHKNVEHVSTYILGTNN